MSSPTKEMLLQTILTRWPKEWSKTSPAEKDEVLDLLEKEYAEMVEGNRQAGLEPAEARREALDDLIPWETEIEAAEKADNAPPSEEEISEFIATMEQMERMGFFNQTESQEKPTT